MFKIPCKQSNGPEESAEYTSILLDVYVGQRLYALTSLFQEQIFQTALRSHLDIACSWYFGVQFS